MDFVTKLPRTTNGQDTIWVIVDRLTKSSHFLAIREDYGMERIARMYINEIVARHGVPISIISDQDTFYVKILSNVIESVRNAVRHEYCLTPSGRWAKRAYNSNVGGHAEGMCD